MRPDHVPVSAPPTVQQHPQVSRKHSEQGHVDLEAKMPHRSHDNTPSRHRQTSSMPVNGGIPPGQRQTSASGNRYAMLQTIPGSTRQGPVPLPSQSFETINQTLGAEADETILLTPSSLNTHAILPSSLQQSVPRPPPQRSSTAPQSSSRSQARPSKHNTDPPRRSEQRRSRIIDDREVPPVARSHGHGHPAAQEHHRTVPIHGLDHAKPFNPFKYLGGGRRKRTLSIASVEARDGVRTATQSHSSIADSCARQVRF